MLPELATFNNLKGQNLSDRPISQHQVFVQFYNRRV